MDVLTSLDDICSPWTGNKANRYGPDVATYATEVKGNVNRGEKTDAVSVEGHHFTVQNHTSGTPLPTISLTAVDLLGQGPAVGKGNKDIVATMSSPDAFFAGSTSMLLNADDVNVSATGFVSPGTYKVVVVFGDEDLENLEIEVEVKKCSVGEVPSGNGTFCEACSASTFSFRPEDDLHCHPCPDNANCESRTIQPHKGYWHRTPCSEHIQRCLTSEACDFKHRDRDLNEATVDVETCDFDEDYIRDYTDAQCREVIAWIVVGSWIDEVICLAGTRGTALWHVQGIVWSIAFSPLPGVLFGLWKLRLGLSFVSCSDGVVQYHDP